MHMALRTVLLLVAGCAVLTAEAIPVTATLSFKSGQPVFKTGEPVILNLTFIASSPGFSLNVTTPEPASPIDEFVLAPLDGAFAWLEDQARGHRYTPDYMYTETLEPGVPKTVILPLNALYRFDAPGHYSLRITSGRVLYSDRRISQGAGPLTTNSVDFEIEPMSEAEDRARAQALEKKIRTASNQVIAQRYASELNWLAGDGSIPAKLSLFLNPKEFYSSAVDVSQGLWIARNRSLVVADLEKALSDPEQVLFTGLLRTTIALKANLKQPFNPAFPNAPLPTRSIEENYTREIAATFGQRKDTNLVKAAEEVFALLGERKRTNAPQFSAAREILITHFAEVDPLSVDWLLNTYGAKLRDPRLVPAFKQILETKSDPALNGDYAAVLNQWIKIDPEGSRHAFAEEVCAVNTTLLASAIYEAPFETLPETNGCLLGALRTATDPAKPFEPIWAAEFVARFATPEIYDDVLAIYRKSANAWSGQTRGYLLAYLMRCDPQRGLPLLESALPANSPDSQIFYALGDAYSPSLESFCRNRLASAPAEQAINVAYLLSQHGPAEDQAILRARLDRWRKEWQGRVIPDPEGALESELIKAVVSGKNWRLPDSEAAELTESCLSDICKSRLH